MLRKSLLILMSSIFFIPYQLISQSKHKKDREAILSMCGCFEINFKFIETFNYSEYDDYNGSDEYESYALELALPIVNEKNKISIQHLLIVGSVEKNILLNIGDKIGFIKILIYMNLLAIKFGKVLT